MTDIVIPVLNEEKILRENKKYYLRLKTSAGLIFVDGGSADRTLQIAKHYGEVIVSPRGRARQMNAGAKICRGENILFLHADTLVSDEALLQMEDVFKKGMLGGCFSMTIMEEGFIFRVFEFLVNFRARHFQIIDGDLGMFVKKEVFDRLGGFDQATAMEDILFSKKLRKAAKAVSLPGKIFVSGRRWHEEGFWKTFWKYSWAYFDLWTGRLSFADCFK